MRILYVRHHEQTVGERLTDRWQRTWSLHDQDAHFEAALRSHAQVVVCSVVDLLKHGFASYGCDALLFNYKVRRSMPEELRQVFFYGYLPTLAVPKGIVATTDRAQDLPPQHLLNVFDVMYKREPYRDRSRYAKITRINARKIVPIMLPCPLLLPLRWRRLDGTLRPRWSAPRPCSNSESTYDVNFSGSIPARSSVRQDAWCRVVDAGFHVSGGLQSNDRKDLIPPPELTGERQYGSAYRQAICDAKINLALTGIGEFTYRHLELGCLGAFVLSSGSIREQELLVPAQEDVHYVAYDTLDELEEKIRYYLAHETERRRIAEAGRQLFLEHYDPSQHGQRMVDALTNVAYHSETTTS